MFDTPRTPLLAALCLFAVTAPALAADPDPEYGHFSGWYIRGDIGAVLTDADNQSNTEDGIGLGAGVGYQFNDLLRADVTFDGTFDLDFDNTFGTNIDTYSVMANAYIDMPFSFFFTPYVGGGIGWGEVNGGAFNNDDGVALSGMAGLTYGLPNNGWFDIGYKARYIDINTGVSDYWLDHSFRIGVRYGF